MSRIDLFAVTVTPVNPHPLDDGLQMTVLLPARTSLQAMKRLNRYLRYHTAPFGAVRRVSSRYPFQRPRKADEDSFRQFRP